MIPDNVLALIAKPKSNKRISIPDGNVYIPKNVALVEVSAEHSSVPVNVSNIKGTDVWFLQDSKFKQPKGIVQMKLHTNDNGFGSNNEGRVFAKLWERMQKEYQHELVSLAQQIGMIFFLEVDLDGISFFWKGYNNTLPKYISETISNMYKLGSLDKKKLENLFEQ